MHLLRVLATASGHEAQKKKRNRTNQLGTSEEEWQKLKVVDGVNASTARRFHTILALQLSHNSQVP